MSLVHDIAYIIPQKVNKDICKPYKIKFVLGASEKNLHTMPYAWLNNHISANITSHVYPNRMNIYKNFQYIIRSS